MFRKVFAAICCGLLLSLQWACSLNPIPESTSTVVQGGMAADIPLADDSSLWSDYHWGQVSFHIDWPADRDEPQWFWDLYLAEQIARPLLEQFQTDIALWRFHRRAARDSSGHRFSVMFYAPKALVIKFYKAASEHPKVLQLMEKAVIRHLSFADIENNEHQGLHKGSDTNWSPSIQKHWPYFMYGVSRMWLGLLGEVSQQQALQDEQTDVAEHYRRVHKKMDVLWDFQGAHAFLHHLNGIFGYRELTVIERKKMRF